MFTLGCIQALQCNKNCCPTGITTHKKRLQKGLNSADKAVRVSLYAQRMVKEIGTIAHSCRVVADTGRSIPLTEFYPDVVPGSGQAA